MSKYYFQEEIIKKIISKIDVNSNLKILLKEYKNFLISISASFSKVYKYSPLTYDDYYQMANFYFIDRTLKFDLKYNKHFPAYISEFVFKDLNNYAKKFITNKHKSLNLASTEESIINNFFYEEVTDLNDLYLGFFKKEEKELYDNILKNDLNYKKVSKELNIPLKSVYRKKDQIINKIKKFN